jgi:molybdopterin molybdotransferase
VSLRSIADHRAHVLGLVAPGPVEDLPLGESLGLVLAEDVIARTDLPGFDNSAMDGYAVRSSEVASASEGAPVRLPVEGDIAAGDTRAHTLTPGHAMRIMTGAPMPAGADGVVPVEDSDGGSGQVALRAGVAPGRHVRARGTDIREGEVVLTAGTLLTPARLALAAAANVPTVRCVRRPRVAIVSTGDELVPPGSALEHGQIVDSNGVMLSALVAAAGAELVGAGHVRDDAEALGALLADVPGEPDLILTTGGVSMGVYDTVKEVLTGSGVEFVKVAMRPGMPQGSGLVGGQRTPIITLPGNPVSALVSFHVFVVPALRRLAGRAEDEDTLPAVAGASWSSAAGKGEFTRVRLEEGVAVPVGVQGSHVLGAMAQANALAIVPAETVSVSPGDALTCVRLLGQDG